jgi:NDP-sugar pyrophosphorylase family protein
MYMKPEMAAKIKEFMKDELTPSEKGSVRVVFSMGGGGTRVRHITQDKYSKHLIMVRDKPISRYVVDEWVNQGFTQTAMLVDDTHRGKSVTDYYKKGEDLNININYSIEHTKLGSGGAIRLAIQNKVIDRSFVNHYPDDIIINYPEFPSDFTRVFIAAMKAGFQCIILCVPGKRYPYGVVQDDGERVINFMEKPFIEMDTNTGLYAVAEDVFPAILELEENKEIKIERSVFVDIAREGKMLKVMLPTEYWIPVNDENSLKKLVEIVKDKSPE